MITNLLINTDVSPVGQKPLSRTIFREVGLVGQFEILAQDNFFRAQSV